MKLALLIVALAAIPMGAHHGATGFDQNKPVHLAGKIVKVDWVNPHVVIHLDVAGASWRVSTIPPIAAVPRGFPQSSFAAGTELTVDGHQALDGTNLVNATRVAFPDGKAIVSPDCFASPKLCFSPREAQR
jgi:hypothetical protein